MIMIGLTHAQFMCTNASCNQGVRIMEYFVAPIDPEERSQCKQALVGKV